VAEFEHGSCGARKTFLSPSFPGKKVKNRSLKTEGWGTRLYPLSPQRIERPKKWRHLDRVVPGKRRNRPCGLVRDFSGTPTNQDLTRSPTKGSEASAAWVRRESQVIAEILCI
jgi:hypothetical protein